MILLTGATGYIGSHTWVELLDAGYEVVGVDNFVNSSSGVLKRINQITNKELLFVEGDIRNKNILDHIFRTYQINAVMHFSALKAVGDSVKKPLDYYRNNLDGLFSLIEVMLNNRCHNFVFSSSATVYDQSNPIPYVEGMKLGSSNPYGWTKVMSEQVLRDVESSNAELSVAYLRYFNPIGAHASGAIGESPLGTPNNLMPYITQVAVGVREFLSVYGGDWPTPDGTGIRDYIHVVDLARGHIKALNYLLKGNGSITANLGAGKGYSVLELISEFEKASGKTIPYRIVARRSGDIAAFYADASLAKERLGWSVELDLRKMCEDSWRWQSMNPNGII